jgi:KipI family sensor histidine kinase inhibitor
MAGLRVEALGDSALLVRLGDRIDDALNRDALALAAALQNAGLPGVVDVAPAYASVTVRCDIAALAGTAPLDRLAGLIGDAVLSLRARAGPAATAGPDSEPDCLDVPVCYGGEFGADLDAVAAHAGLDRRDVIARHARADYRVGMLGFMPGFAYLLGLDASLHMPRRASPRTRVPAGSVAIGGAQTGIYPRELPGGWQLIGRTPLVLFDPQRDPPALLRPGQRVRFREIDPSEFGAARL